VLEFAKANSLLMKRGEKLIEDLDNSNDSWVYMGKEKTEKKVCKMIIKKMFLAGICFFVGVIIGALLIFNVTDGFTSVPKLATDQVYYWR
jgi:hypothetical protein